MYELCKFVQAFNFISSAMLSAGILFGNLHKDIANFQWVWLFFSNTKTVVFRLLPI